MKRTDDRRVGVHSAHGDRLEYESVHSRLMNLRVQKEFFVNLTPPWQVR